MGVEWVTRIPNKIFTRVKAEFSKKIKTKYKMTVSNFSTVGSSDTPAVFPFVYIQQLDPMETGEDLEGTTINGGLFTFQIDVTDNKKQENAKEVMTEVMRIMKTMGFKCKSLPFFDSSANGVFRMTARFRRSIDENDIL